MVDDVYQKVGIAGAAFAGVGIVLVFFLYLVVFDVIPGLPDTGDPSSDLIEDVNGVAEFKDSTLQVPVASGNSFVQMAATTTDLTRTAARQFQSFAGIELRARQVQTDDIFAQNLTADANLTVVGSTKFTGTATVGNLDAARITATGNVEAGNLSTTGTLQAVNGVFSTGVTTTGLTVNGAFDTSGNITAGAFVTAGNVTAGNFSTAGLVDATSVTATGALTAASGSVSGAWSVGELASTANVVAGNLVTAGVVTAASGSVSGAWSVGELASTANVVAGNLVTAGVVKCDTLDLTSGLSVTDLTATGNVAGANLVTSGALEAGSGTITNTLEAKDVTATGLTSTGQLTVSGVVNLPNQSLPLTTLPAGSLASGSLVGYLNAGTSASQVQIGTGLAVGAGGLQASGLFNKVNLRVFSSTGATTYSPAVDVASFVVEVIGGGGNSAAVVVSASGNRASSGGGGGGGYLKLAGQREDHTDGFNINIQGPGGFTDFSSVSSGKVNVRAGAGATGESTFENPLAEGKIGPPGIGGSNTVTVSTDMTVVENIAGEPGQPSIALPAGTQMAGSGGSSAFGNGGASVFGDGNGSAGSGFGGGGGGPGQIEIGSRTATNGATGAVVVTEYLVVT